MVIYQMANEPCKTIITDFINNLEIAKDKTSYEYISFMLTIKNLKFDIDDEELKINIKNHIKSFPSNTFNRTFFGLQSCLDTVCKKDSSYVELANEVDNIIQKYNKNKIPLSTGENINSQ